MKKERTAEDIEIETYYEGIRNMIWSIIHKFNNLTPQDKEDLFQEASVFVTTKLVFKYDKSKNVAFKDFAYICIKNFVLRKVNNIGKYKKVILADSEVLSILPDMVDESSIQEDSNRVSALRKLLERDSCLLKENEKVVLRMIFENPNITQREMSAKMGFSFASGVGAILSRLRKRIKEEGMLEDV